ncbi:maleylpyruvate isomerase family mycothiol-dependent enzyme [Citricoccus sp. NR2]|uniref:maleylpyruvate isomerase family mycothiol-dependent enzyme n=1 Tax=Citricoccus sp. NR2 TaxID=3004095 RepID=UPI0022DE4020|nr:maleylpyruvate isomerase family mycothiol-dependent enzyme [Citricoccus sp. NR2]WBL19569.1 maleylpyruvate isomerase family mycothiol-dependent enzyme [Citricoccus sp. NR2]
MVARYDLATDPVLKQQLLTVRRGTSFWHRKVQEIHDDHLDEPTRLQGWTRRHLIAHVGYNARAIQRLVSWANTGVKTPMYASPEDRAREIKLGATMPARALRHLDHHAAVSLNVEWRDTPPEAWAAVVRTAQGREVPLSETVWMRTREVWLHAIDLVNGARFSDIPAEVLQRLLEDITTAWRARKTDPGFTIEVTDRPGLDPIGAGVENDSRVTIRGDLAAVVAWASGRDASRLVLGQDVPAPRWL